ncbi:MAG: phosphoglucomutase/phosphomannomutase family protein [Chloroflexi bacterium]|nr:phosphoglucomutase/phosphomannomutase family protein [Chloroflexota bacterium]
MANAPTEIRFGTDGWRALIARDYTFENVRFCAEGVCRMLEAKGMANRGLSIGYDCRWGSPEFAEEVAKVSTAHGIKTYLADTIVPTPVLSYSVLHNKAGGGVVITASHNSGLWNGFKYKPDYAGSASQEVVDELERYIAAAQADNSVPTMSLANAEASGVLQRPNMAQAYLANLSNIVDLKGIREAGLKVGFDAMHGAGSGYFEAALGSGKTSITSIRGDRNPSFPGMGQPEPIAPNLQPTIAVAKGGAYDVVLANDGDADRLGVLDEKGNFISTLSTFALLCMYQLEQRQLRGPLVRSITQSAMIDKLADLYGVPVHVTGVGFKYVGQVMMEVDAIAAGEESGGYAFQGNIPERDGILSGLMFLDLMVKTGKRPSELVALLSEKVGAHFYDRLDVTLDANTAKPDTTALAAEPPERIGGLKVERTDTPDGARFILEGGFWGLIRPSGTEPLLRIYAEGDSPERVQEMLRDLRTTAGV